MKKYEEESGESWHSRYREKRNAYMRDYAVENGNTRQRYPELMKAHDELRTARERGASDGVPINRREVFERDGWICGLCLLPIDPALQWPDRFSASVDHIQPLILGGAHTLANVQAAHLTCNTTKGARV